MASEFTKIMESYLNKRALTEGKEAPTGYSKDEMDKTIGDNAKARRTKAQGYSSKLVDLLKKAMTDKNTVKKYFLLDNTKHGAGWFKNENLKQINKILAGSVSYSPVGGTGTSMSLNDEDKAVLAKLPIAKNINAIADELLKELNAKKESLSEGLLSIIGVHGLNDLYKKLTNEVGKHKYAKMEIRKADKTRKGDKDTILITVSSNDSDLKGKLVISDGKTADNFNQFAVNTYFGRGTLDHSDLIASTPRKPLDKIETDVYNALKKVEEKLGIADRLR